MEQSFLLMYGMQGGLKWDDIQEMETSERLFHLKRLVEQKQMELEAIEGEKKKLERIAKKSK